MLMGCHGWLESLGGRDTIQWVGGLGSGDVAGGWSRQFGLGVFLVVEM